MQKSMKKFREILTEVFNGLTTPQNTPKNAQKQVEKLLNPQTSGEASLIREFVAYN
jgi:uncharacterized protein (UPF0147 family)